MDPLCASLHAIITGLLVWVVQLQRRNGKREP